MNTKILFVTTGLGIGGAETLLLAIARELQMRGFTVTIASLRSDNPLTKRFEDAGLEVIEFDANPKRIPYAVTKKIAALIKERDIKFVQGWMYHGNLIAYFASWLAGLKTKEQSAFGIFGVWPDMSTYGRATGLVARLGGWLSSRVKCVVYNADTAATDHEDRGYSKKNSLAIGNCIDIDHFTKNTKAREHIRSELGLGSNDVVAIIAARNHPQKDWPTMLEALSGVESLKTIAVGHRTEDLPDHPGLLRLGPRDDMAALYSASDFFVLTSAFGEGTSLGMSEAMSCSLPVIMTAIGDNARFVDKSGFAVGVGDVEGLRAAARQLTENSQLRGEMSKHARKVAIASFSTSRNIEPLIPIYQLSENNSIEAQ